MRPPGEGGSRVETRKGSSLRGAGDILHDPAGRADNPSVVRGPPASGARQLQPLVSPQVSHFRHVPFRTIVHWPQFRQGSPSYPHRRARRARSSTVPRRAATEPTAAGAGAGAGTDRGWAADDARVSCVVTEAALAADGPPPPGPASPGRKWLDSPSPW